MRSHRTAGSGSSAEFPLRRASASRIAGAEHRVREIGSSACRSRPETTHRHPLPSLDRLASVYVTFGTFFSTNLEPFRVVLDALAGEPIDVVATVGEQQDPASLGPIPSNTRVERFIPQAELLPSCAAVVHHGGAGTTFGALSHGLPQRHHPPTRRQLRTRSHVRNSRSDAHPPARGGDQRRDRSGRATSARRAVLRRRLEACGRGDRGDARPD